MAHVSFKIVPSQAIELVGVAVLGLIITGIGTDIVSVSVPNDMLWVALPLVGLVLVLGTTSLVRWVLGRTSYRWLVIVGTVLVMAGGWIALGAPDYFTHALSLPVSFWHQVCWYTIPAACSEGGNLTLFTVFHEREALLWSPRERFLIQVALVMYSVAIVAANFLVLNGIWQVSGHVLIVRMTTGVALMILIAVMIRKYLRRNIIAQE